MKQSLSLRMGQQLAMTPQLQQAIRLMQLSALELKAEVQQAIESNPMLDLVEDDEDDVVATDDEPPEVTDDTGNLDTGDESVEDGGDPASTDLDTATDEPGEDPASIEDIPDDLPVDVSWDDVYQPTTAARVSAPEDDGGFEERNGADDTLQDRLLWQLELTRLSDRDRLAAMTIIGNIDDDGMLAATVEELVYDMNPALGYGLDEMEAVVKLVQSFEPSGVGARDLAECLCLQLEQLPEDTPWRTEAIGVVRDHFPCSPAGTSSRWPDG